jgi:hypothetical protein
MKQVVSAKVITTCPREPMTTAIFSCDPLAGTDRCDDEMKKLVA